MVVVELSVFSAVIAITGHISDLVAIAVIDVAVTGIAVRIIFTEILRVFVCH